MADVHNLAQELANRPPVFGRRPWRAGLGLAFALTLAACASSPKAPDQALRAAQQAIASAEQARAGEYAMVELNQARDKLTSAHSAVRDKNMLVAERLAIESKIGAELAIASAKESEARAVNEGIRRSNDVLRQEMQRNSGGLQ